MSMGMKSHAAFAPTGGVSLGEAGPKGPAPHYDRQAGVPMPLSTAAQLRGARARGGIDRCRDARVMAAQWLSLLTRGPPLDEAAAPPAHPPGVLELLPRAKESVPQLLHTLKEIAMAGASLEGGPTLGTAESASTAGESGSHSSTSSCSSARNHTPGVGEGETNQPWEDIRVHFDTVCRLVRNRKELSAVLDTAFGDDWCLPRRGDGDGDEPPPLFAEESSPGAPSTLNRHAAPFEARAAPTPTSTPTPTPVALPSPDAAPYYFSGAGLAVEVGRRGGGPPFPSTPLVRPGGAVDLDMSDGSNGNGGATPQAQQSTALPSMSSSLSSPAVTFNLESREEMLRRRASAAAAVQYGMKPSGEKYYDARQPNNRNGPITPPQSFMSLSMNLGYCPFDYLLVLDFEATCEEVTPPSYLHEIIEFPVVVVDVKLQRTVAEFHRFVKPKVQPQLSDFCRRLTGIRQEDVDNAPSLEDVIKQFERWYANTIPPGSRTVFATDGSADLREFMYTHSVLRQGIRFPSMFYQWIDVKRSFAHHFQCQQGKIKAMLDALHCPLEGRLHSGLDDARNVATIVTRMLQLGHSFCEIPLSRLSYATPAALNVGNLLPPSMTAINGTTSEYVKSPQDLPGQISSFLEQ